MLKAWTEYRAERTVRPRGFARDRKDRQESGLEA